MVQANNTQRNNILILCLNYGVSFAALRYRITGEPRTGASTPDVSYLCWVERKAHLSPRVGDPLPNAAQDVPNFCHKDMLLAPLHPVFP